MHRRLPASNAARRMSSIAANAPARSPHEPGSGTPLTGVSKVSEKVGSLPLLASIPMQYWPACQVARNRIGKTIAEIQRVASKRIAIPRHSGGKKDTMLNSTVDFENSRRWQRTVPRPS